MNTHLARDVGDAAPRLPRLLLILALVIGAALRLYPLHLPEPNPELQHHFARLAVRAVAADAWEREYISHGVLLLDVLEIGFEGWYRIGRRTGRYHDRLDFLADYVRDPWPFVVAAKVLIATCSITTLLLVAWIGHTCFGPLAGALATVVLAGCFVHVRASHHVWLDVPGAFGAAAAVAAALRASRRPTTGAFVLAATVAGLAVAANHRNAPVGALPLVAALLTPGLSTGRRIRWAAMGVGVSVTAFLAVSPLIVLDLAGTKAQLALERQAWSARTGARLGLPLTQAFPLAFGIGPLVLATAGILVALREAWRPALLVLALPVASLLTLLGAPYFFLRYLTVLAPFVALFAGAGAARVARTTPGPAWGSAIAGGLVVLACADPIARAAGYVALRGRTDTRVLAGAWITAHVTPPARLTLPNAVDYLSPVLPPTRAQLRLQHRAFAAALEPRILGDEPGYELAYLRVFSTDNTSWEPTPGSYVVTASHPAVAQDLLSNPDVLARIRRAGGRQVAQFTGVAEPLSPTTVFEARDAEFLPLTGFSAVTNPGPNLTIWHVPAR